MAASKGVHPANFYLGFIYLGGDYIQRDIEKAIDFYVRGAAKNNAFCYFELSRIYSGNDEVERDRYLEFTYLKRAAEEGYVMAQHMLGQCYHSGKLVERNDKKALAWLRESVRNGNAISYLSSAELLDHAGDFTTEGMKKENIVPRNRLFAFVNYFGAYQNGAFFLRETMEALSKEIKEKDGINLPEIVYIDPTKL